MKMHKRTNNDLQNMHIKPKSNTNPLKTGMNAGASEGSAFRAPLVTPVVLNSIHVQLYHCVNKLFIDNMIVMPILY
jgi:hypothetical protein